MTEKEKQDRLSEILANRSQSDDLVEQLLDVQAGRSSSVSIRTVDGRTYKTKVVPLQRVGTALIENPTKPPKE
jgi:hypothetical protein